MASPKAESEFVVFDVGQLVKEHSNKTGSDSIKLGHVFLSSPLVKATNDDNLNLRNELRIVTILNTQARTDVIYRFIKNGPVQFARTYFDTERIMGLTLHHVDLRIMGYIQSILDELSAKVIKEINTRNALNGHTDPQNLSIFRSRVMLRDSVEDSFIILTRCMEQIRRVFDTVLCNARNYPLLIAGDELLRDNSIILFLLLLLLDVPVQIIEDIHRSLLAIPISQNYWSSEPGSRLCEIWLGSKDYWAKALKGRIDTKYGGIKGYLTAAGISEAAQEMIVDILKPSGPDNGGDDAPPPYDPST